MTGTHLTLRTNPQAETAESSEYPARVPDRVPRLRQLAADLDPIPANIHTPNRLIEDLSREWSAVVLQVLDSTLLCLPQSRVQRNDDVGV